MGGKLNSKSKHVSLKFTMNFELTHCPSYFTMFSGSKCMPLVWNRWWVGVRTQPLLKVSLHSLKFKWPKTILNSSYQFWAHYSSLPSLLQMCVTSLFLLWFAHCLKRWTPDFLSFKTICNLSKNDLGKCSRFQFKVTVYVAARFQVLNCHVN